MPLAIEVGLTPIQFWYGDLFLLDVYVEAYNNRAKNTAILFGMYTNIAVRTAVAACLGEKQGTNYVKVIQEMEAETKSRGMKKESQTEDFNNKMNFWSTLKSRMGK